MALILITHNMGVVAETAERVAVMYAGQMMEERASPSCSPRRSIPIRRRCWRRCPSAARARRAWPPSPAWCRVCTIARRLPVQRRAAAMRPPHSRRSARAARHGWVAGSAVIIRSVIRRARRACAAAARGARGRCRAAATGMSAHRRARNDLDADYVVRRGLFRAPAQLHAVGGVSFTLEPARRWRWSANPAAASRRWRAS